ncbi:MAG: hypothetical protein JEZ06_00225 [Anaerolineaceae bacterium]|nr:hypothetical protein [Anaerolineaceae bacterium]
MKTLNILYHMARADFFERTRQYSFLIMIGMIMWLGYAAASAQIIMRISPDYTGEPNSAWAGTLMALTVTFFLGWFGFYFIKGSVARDYDTGVGQIMATTPLSRPVYMIGKWISNFAVISVMIFILMGAGILMILFAGMPLDLWALIAPLLIISIPCMALVAGLAVLFESIAWLRGGLGNVVYFIAFILVIIPSMETAAYVPMLDVLGVRLIADSISHAAQIVYPASGGFSFTITALDNPKYFSFPGIPWTVDVVFWRIMILFFGMAVALLASVFFDRFNPRRISLKRKKSIPDSARPDTVSKTIPAPQGRLTPLTAHNPHFQFLSLFIIELKLLLKGQRWWWYLISAGLLIAQIINPIDNTHNILLFSWLWLILVLGKLGNRESRHNTQQMVFSTPHPVLSQLPAAWLASFTVVFLAGSGAFLKFLFIGDLTGMLALLAGAAFTPSLALVLGIMTGSSKTFEIIYVLWMYLILQKIPVLDFVGITSEGPWQIFGFLAVGLLILSAFIRQKKIQTM